MGKYRDDFLILMATFIPTAVAIWLDFQPWLFFCCTALTGIMISSFFFFQSWFWTYHKTALKIQRESKKAIYSENNVRCKYTKKQLKKKYIVLVGFALGFLYYHEGPGTVNINNHIRKIVLSRLEKKKYFSSNIIEETKEDVVNMSEDEFNNVEKSALIIKNALIRYEIDEKTEEPFASYSLRSFWGAMHSFFVK